jgi:hypothetical protein
MADPRTSPPTRPPRQPRWPWLGLPAGALALAAATLWLATESTPRVASDPAPSTAAGVHLRQWLRAHDPRRMADGRSVVLVAGPEELQLLVDQAARMARGAGRAQLDAGRLRLQASVPLGPRWINVDLGLGNGDSLPSTLRHLRIGRLDLPAPLAAAAIDVALRVWWDRPAGHTGPLREMLQGLQLQPGQALLRYRWRADLPHRLAGWLMPPSRLDLLRRYHEALAAVVQRDRRPQELTDLMAPLFALAQARSQAGADAATENRAALLALAVYASGRPAAAWWPAARAWPPVPPRGARLAGRGDFPQHFLISAALAAEGGGPLADALGLMKEIGDTQGGSGFSFNDIAVNRAGARLGELAVRDPQRVQAWLAAAPVSETLLPDVSALPEFLTRAELESRYGGVGAPAYDALLAEIEARISALALYR